MIPNVRDRELQSEGVAAQRAFGISRTNEAHIMTILRDTLYTDRVMAPLREYSANAWDAHRSVGKDTVPIKVTLPTAMDPTLTIRDFGPGMSHEDVFNIYTQYGASTKRNSDTQVGMLGIGSKSAFAYADSFTITSWNGGMKRIYVSVLDESDEGRINLMLEEPCAADDTGIQIQIAVKHDDIAEFTRKAQQLFQHFDPQPEINVEISNPLKEYTRLKTGYIHNTDHGYGNWTAVMGCVPYRINLQQITGEGQEALPDYVFQLGGVIKFDIGEVQINASREELKYSVSTKKLIRERINDLVDEYVTFVLKEIKDKAKTAWERRLLARSYKLFMLPVPEVEKMFGGQTVSLLPTPSSFVFGVFKKNKRVDVEKHLRIHQAARVIIRDDERSIQGYRLGENDYVVCKQKSFGMPAVELALETFLAERALTGIPIVKISTLPWESTSYGRNNSSTVTPRASLKVFELTDPSAYRGRALSTCWSPLKDWTASDDDVYVVLEKFDPGNGFYQKYIKDKVMLEGFDIKMPKIIGFRSTSSKPVDPAACKGLNYEKWREKMFADLVIKKHDVFSMWTKAHRFESLEAKGHKAVLKLLGVDHPITTYIADHVKAQKTIEKYKRDLTNAISNFFESRGLEGVPDDEGKALKERYPLLGCYGFQRLWESWSETDDNAETESDYKKRGREWVRYIKLIDSIDNSERKAA